MSFPFQGDDVLDDEALTKAFQRIKHNLNDSEIREAFYNVRDEIHKYVKTCDRNIRVVIYFDDVLDDPLVVVVGPGENRLRITIKRNGKVTYSWTKETWAKFFRDAWEGIKSFTANILQCIVSNICPLLKVATKVARKAITYF